MAGFVLLFLAFSITIILQLNLNTAQTYIHNFCFEDYNATTIPTFDANLNLLLSSISNNTAVINSTSFHTNTVGRFPDMVYGIFQCRGDLTSQDCKVCAEVVIEDLKSRCQYQKEAIMWYNQCWLRYSPHITISTMIGDPKIYRNIGRTVSNPNLFTNRLELLMDGLVARAVNSTNMFATGEVNVTSTQTIYGLVQCSQDISRRDCGRCLAKSINQIPPCCDGKDAGRILKPSCILWFDDNRFFESSTFSASSTGKENSSKAVIIAVVVAATVFVSLCIIIFFFYSRKNERYYKKFKDVAEIPTVESLQFKFGTISAATNNFKDGSKLGEGGFGAVYKGMLPDGREIAVKRLSKNSGQGVEEFKNEVVLLARLRHRSLVKLLGFCLEGNEKLLIYEFVENASLDQIIFDKVKCTNLNWERRYNIIVGVARGLLYLHEDSPDRIIHRDLKASNVLLDAQMNPKICDFGLARLFPMDQTQGSTRKIVGTYGYMPPEYLMQGHFSVKLDVFSYGVLVLEIITGQRNSSFHQVERDHDLLSYAWKHWKEGTALEIVETTIRKEYSSSEVLKCVQMGMLCVQEDVAKRPTMASIVIMLSSDTYNLPTPSAPAFSDTSTMDFVKMMGAGETQSTERSQSVQDPSFCGSVDDSTITVMRPR